MNPELSAALVAADGAALTAAGAVAEEALACHREALILLANGWSGENGSAITDLVQRQCSRAADVVAELRRAAGEFTVAQQQWTPGEGPTRVDVSGFAEADPLPRDPVGAAGVDTASPPPAPPAPVAQPVPPVPAAAPMAPFADLPSASAALPTAALPDLGGMLVGLVAQIAQALGSYAEPGPASDRPPADRTADPPAVRTADTPADRTAQTGHPAPPDGRGPADRPEAQLPSTAAGGPSGAPELLAAERPPDPGASPVPQQPLQAGAPGPVDTPGPQPQAAEAPAVAPDPSRTPCEIAADELPTVGQ